jgi:hypothetical protein
LRGLLERQVLPALMLLPERQEQWVLPGLELSRLPEQRAAPELPVLHEHQEQMGPQALAEDRGAARRRLRRGGRVA